jgi:hypothetical protein
VATRHSPHLAHAHMSHSLRMRVCRIPRSDVFLAGALSRNKAECQVHVRILLLCFWEIMNSILDSDTSSVFLSKYEYSDLKVATAGFHILMNYVFTVCYNST